MEVHEIRKSVLCNPKVIRKSVLVYFPILFAKLFFNHVNLLFWNNFGQNAAAVKLNNKHIF